MNLNRLAYFVAVVETGSFTRASERLGTTKSVVSQQVALLEEELRTTLLMRTTRRVHPTEAGQAFHARCLTILREAEDAFEEMALSSAVPTGTLRITSPNDYGVAVVIPVVADFAARYPMCRVEQILGDRPMDLTSGLVDLAVRVGWLADSSLQARKVGSFRQLLVGAPALAAAISTLREPADLVRLPFIANLALPEPLGWTFSHRGLGQQSVRLEARIAIDTTPGVLAAVQLGAGLSILPDYLVEQDLTADRLIRVLAEWQLPSGGIHAVYPAARFRPPKITAFVELLMAAQRERSSASDPAV